jgi:NADH:ubiquinone oxidoreductase subunit E
MMDTITVDKNLSDIFERYEGKREELIPLLQDVQAEFGYLPGEARTGISKFLNVPESVVYGVVTFYAQFYLTRQGKHKIKVCCGTACHVRGGDRIMQALKRRLEIGVGETTPDYQFTLERVACFGSCALAPVVVIDNKVYGRMTSPRAEAILEEITIEDQQ